MRRASSRACPPRRDDGHRDVHFDRIGFLRVVRVDDREERVVRIGALEIPRQGRGTLLARSVPERLDEAGLFVDSRPLDLASHPPHAVLDGGIVRGIPAAYAEVDGIFRDGHAEDLDAQAVRAVGVIHRREPVPGGAGVGRLIRDEVPIVVEEPIPLVLDGAVVEDELVRPGDGPEDAHEPGGDEHPAGRAPGIRIRHGPSSFPHPSSGRVPTGPGRPPGDRSGPRRRSGLRLP